MNNNYGQVLAEYCLKKMNLNSDMSYGYESLPICIIDCVYSLRAQYYPTTISVVQRYADKYLNGNVMSKKDTVSDFINHVEIIGGADEFAYTVLENRQEINGIIKSEICFKLAQYLQCLGIETLDDFRRYKNQELLEIVIRSVKGIGDAGTNYLFMLAGDDSRCKADVHIHQCIVDAIGFDFSNEDCQLILQETAAILRKTYLQLTVKKLDYIIWSKYRK